MYIGLFNLLYKNDCTFELKNLFRGCVKIRRSHVKYEYVRGNVYSIAEVTLWEKKLLGTRIIYRYLIGLH